MCIIFQTEKRDVRLYCCRCNYCLFLGTCFTVLWENVTLQDNRKIGTFTFSVSLHKIGQIVFTYFSVPIEVSTIHDDKHPVKIGLSDAYIIDKTIVCKYKIRSK